jgi:hypothetical protein
MTKQVLDVLAPIQRIYNDAIPSSIRSRCSQSLSKCGQSFDQLFNRVYPEVFVLEGQEKNSGHPLTFAYAGAHPQILEYWAHTVLAAGFRKYSLGRYSFMEVPDGVQRDHPDCNFLLMESHDLTRPYLKKQAFHIPEWVEMVLDISGSVEKLFGNRRSDIQAWVQLSGFTFELARDPQQFDDFYNDMYLPYARERAGASENSTCASLSEIFSRGELILVKKEGLVVGGGLFEVQGQQAKCRAMGVRDGHDEDALAACYYFLIMEMKKRGYKKVHLGGARPFLNDEATRIKISLKAEASAGCHHACVSLALLRDSEGLQNFLINNPFICFEKEYNAHRAVFFQLDDKDNEGFNEMIQGAICYGLARTHIFVFSEEMAERSNYFFSVLSAWRVFDNSMPFVRERSVV